MKITHAHYDFWCQHKMKVSWYPTADMLKRTGMLQHKDISIHSLIPTDKKIDKNFTAHNLLVSVKRQKPDYLLAYLFERIKDPGTIMSPQRVSGYCRKWLYRILTNQIKEGRMPQDKAETAKYVLDILDALSRSERQLRSTRYATQKA